jgi:hypothetical protein
MTKALGPFRRVLRNGHYVLESMATKSIAARAVNIAKTEEGETEHPHGSNHQKYGRYWHEDGVPWCGLFVAYCWHEAGFQVSRALAQQIGYVPTLVTMARNHQHNLFIVGRNRVRKGDAVALNFDASPESDHVELFDHWIDKKLGIFACVGGNTSKKGSQANGGQVCAGQIRYTKNVVAFVRKGK